ncbi:Pkinase-domain-containing protein [Vararia minispora EC-137]|uniref:Pkinase-domain-containing protein n=1 Tax=Vararia minispora EC-137 TaxID=1314806 RepID=A0ACB8QCB3_9AGAM|nr:Pkinase-domain-containing protein [Vararia minispora EC-137]
MDQLPQSWLVTLDRIKYHAQDALSTVAGCICQQQSKLKINGRTFHIVRVLGEGGFSFVYLAKDEASGREFALKKIFCPMGMEGVKQAMREVEAYRRFRHPNIIRILDTAVVQDGEGKIVYLFLPVYKRGNLQDEINRHMQAGTHYSERHILQLFKGTCEAVRAMHTYRTPVRGSTTLPAAVRQDDERHDAVLLHREDDPEGGYSYEDVDAAVSVPLVAKQQAQTDDVVFDGDQELLTGANGPAAGDIVPYAHRDLKPGNVMLADDGLTPILMDFGSCIKARISIENRSQALLQQDTAAEHSTMAYRAPELFDVKTGITLDEKVDIWSLGCVLFALAYLHSPFENTQTTEQGGSIALAVQSARYKHPASQYSDGFKALIDSMLKVDPKDRPDISQVLSETNRLLQAASAR